MENSSVALTQAQQPVCSVYALLVTRRPKHNAYTTLVRQAHDMYGDEALIWDSLAEALTLTYGHFLGKEVPDAVFVELVDVYLGHTTLVPEFRSVLMEFILLHRGPLDEMLQRIQLRGERIQATYPALHYENNYRGFMLFECVKEKEGDHGASPYCSH